MVRDSILSNRTGIDHAFLYMLYKRVVNLIRVVRVGRLRSEKTETSKFFNEKAGLFLIKILPILLTWKKIGKWSLPKRMSETLQLITDGKSGDAKMKSSTREAERSASLHVLSPLFRQIKSESSRALDSFRTFSL